MQTLPRLLLLVSLVVTGTAWSVTAYLAGMREVEEVRAESAPPAPAVEAHEGGVALPTVVLSVDPTLEDAIGLRTGARLRRLADLR